MNMCSLNNHNGDSGYGSGILLRRKDKYLDSAKCNYVKWGILILTNKMNKLSQI